MIKPVIRPIINSVISIDGEEQIINGDFSGGITGWYEPRVSSTLSIVSGNLRSVSDGTNTFGQAQQLDDMVIGGSYVFTASALSNNSSVLVRLRVGDSSTLSTGLVVEVQGMGSSLASVLFEATATTMYVGTINTGHITGDYVDLFAGISIKRSI